MVIISFVLIAILVIFQAYCIYILYRNKKTYNFRMEISEMCYDYNDRRIKERDLNFKSAYEWFYEKYSYEKMLYSFKPLKLEVWFTEKELEEINR